MSPEIKPGFWPPSSLLLSYDHQTNTNYFPLCLPHNIRHDFNRLYAVDANWRHMLIGHETR